MLKMTLKRRKTYFLNCFLDRKVKGMSIGNLIFSLFCGLLIAIFGFGTLSLFCALILSGRISRWEEEHMWQILASGEAKTRKDQQDSQSKSTFRCKQKERQENRS